MYVVSDNQRLCYGDPEIPQAACHLGLGEQYRKKPRRCAKRKMLEDDNDVMGDNKLFRNRYKFLKLAFPQ